ncbi:hypothetical protein O181_036660 [Austropuccinia psidii MF-1]|uniref:Retrovirus-related Pol polyprotein from transposon TNT 1-94-like beta-barrel domain-containing protein n=1 Tax=Austropuccinia psidii MF-1 TaxID=1389203 RepID=A0A9Q3HCD9_9BASI|nr:hypothetical protein [Austropuccinia psidii MF-1]
MESVPRASQNKINESLKEKEAHIIAIINVLFASNHLIVIETTVNRDTVLIDSVASYHFFNDKNMFQNLKSGRFGMVRTGKGSEIPVVGPGIVIYNGLLHA